MVGTRTIPFWVVASICLVASTALGDETRAETGPERGLVAPAAPETGGSEEARPSAVSPLPDGFRPGSTYGYRISPRTGRRTFHAGLDFLAPRGTEVRAPYRGVVERVTQDRTGRTRFGGYGAAVVVYHPDLGQWSFYAHLGAVDVIEGQLLETGDSLGRVGNSTNQRYPNMACHLHFEVRRARPSDRSPFPAPYGRYNLDPGEWLRALGVRYSRREREPTAGLAR